VSGLGQSEPADGFALRVAPFAALDGTTVYALLRLRAEVFVVEQACAFNDLDGRDLEPTTWHCWFDADGSPAAYLRVLVDQRATRIGRVVTAPSHRRQGLAERLVRHAVDRLAAPGSDVVLDAQSHLVGWYRRLGFAVDGAEFFEDGIPHTPMRRA
jgi:ElaA protein